MSRSDDSHFGESQPAGLFGLLQLIGMFRSIKRFINAFPSVGDFHQDNKKTEPAIPVSLIRFQNQPSEG